MKSRFAQRLWNTTNAFFTIVTILALFIWSARGCHHYGVASCCCGGCGGGRGYKALSAKSFDLEKPRIDGLSLWSEAEIDKHSYSFEQITDPNFLFTRCCSERNLPDGCIDKCSLPTYTESAIRAMFLHMDACPLQYAPELQFCAAQGRDHTECCIERGVDTTSAGEKCLQLCDQRPDKFVQVDLSYAPCQDKFEEMKSCFYDGVRRAAKDTFFPRQKIDPIRIEDDLISR